LTIAEAETHWILTIPYHHCIALQPKPPKRRHLGVSDTATYPLFTFERSSERAFFGEEILMHERGLRSIAYARCQRLGSAPTPLVSWPTLGIISDGAYRSFIFEIREDDCVSSHIHRKELTPSLHPHLFYRYHRWTPSSTSGLAKDSVSRPYGRKPWLVTGFWRRIIWTLCPYGRLTMVRV